MRILVLDNYDSFTYNLVYLIRELGFGAGLAVHRNDKLALAAVGEYDKILLSPGPGVPAAAGIMPAVIEQFAPHKSILGVCLGHQGIAESFGARLHNLEKVQHGVATATQVHSSRGVFAGLPPALRTGRYHSWTVVPESVPATLEITATDENGHVMGLRHRQYDVQGVQFHPESVLTEYGREMMQNWLQG